MEGTPRNLRQAIRNSITTYLPDPAREIFAAEIEAHVVDFLAQRFGVEFLVHGDDAATLKILKELYEQVSGRKII